MLSCVCDEPHHPKMSLKLHPATSYVLGVSPLYFSHSPKNSFLTNQVRAPTAVRALFQHVFSTERYRCLMTASGTCSFAPSSPRGLSSLRRDDIVRNEWIRFKKQRAAVFFFLHSHPVLVTIEMIWVRVYYQTPSASFNISTKFRSSFPSTNFFLILWKIYSSENSFHNHAWWPP